MLEQIGNFIESHAYKENEGKRLNRRQFFMTFLSAFLASLFFNSIVMKLLGNSHSQIAYTLANIFLLIIGLGIYWMAIGTGLLMRYHDKDKSGKKEVSIFLIIYTIFAVFQYSTVIITDVWGVNIGLESIKPIILIIFVVGMLGYLIYMMLTPGTKGSNTYGPEASNTRQPASWAKKENK